MHNSMIALVDLHAYVKIVFINNNNLICRSNAVHMRNMFLTFRSQFHQPANGHALGRDY